MLVGLRKERDRYCVAGVTVSINAEDDGLHASSCLLPTH